MEEITGLYVRFNESLYPKQYESYSYAGKWS